MVHWQVNCTTYTYVPNRMRLDRLLKIKEETGVAVAKQCDILSTNILAATRALRHSRRNSRNMFRGKYGSGMQGKPKRK